MTWLPRLLHYLETTGFGAFLLGMTIVAFALIEIGMTK